MQPRLLCCATEIRLTLRVIQPCMQVGFDVMRRRVYRNIRLNLSQTAIYPTILRKMPDTWGVFKPQLGKKSKLDVLA